MLHADGRFARGYTGWVKPAEKVQGVPAVGVYFEPAAPLDPSTTYTVQVTARSPQGAVLSSGKNRDRWSFTTAGAPRKESLAIDLDIAARPVRWKGVFFSGFGKADFCNSALGLEPTYAMMARDRKKYPKAWQQQRDHWPTAMDHNTQGTDALFYLPNVVREIQTRRIAAITAVSQGYSLKVEDFFGHEQYGIAANRPLSDDYKKDYEVLIADGVNHVRAKVLAADDQARTVLVAPFKMPEGGFKIDDPAKYNKVADPRTPGLFPMTGCYLRRFNPVGTPRYYWGRIDKEWDIARRYGNRLHVNFVDAAGDLSDRGQNCCPPKDYAQLHEVTRQFANHVIERYGAEAALDCIWSIFNEPDLTGFYWKGTPRDLQLFYDYSTDAILRAFEDHKLDSGKVFIGGLELAAIFPNLHKLDGFLRHCSPHGSAADSLNAAMADKRLDGKRSRRVESHCRAHGGKGAPLDFISIHTYGCSAAATGKLKLAKDKALAIDPEYYDKLWVSTHESCPAWMLTPDAAFTECYLGNGYYSSWCADFVWRQLRQGQRDPRYALGDSILTWWPNPNHFEGYGFRFGQTTAATQVVEVDDNGDGRADRQVTLPTPIYNFFNLLGSLVGDYWVLPERTAAGHTVAGFASRGPEGELRVLLYSHNPADVQACTGQGFEMQLNVAGLRGGALRVEQFRFDRDHHSYYELAKKICARADKTVLRADELHRMEEQVALKAENVGEVHASADGKLHLRTSLAGSGVTFLVIQEKK